ncbi:hypothetical protein KC851_01450 [Candidatus Kaiserbacteria bacterium]|nr:hypothetical protein [Candidatus Kaiserbacteria bacterium]
MKTLGVRTVSLTEAMGEVSERLRREKSLGDRPVCYLPGNCGRINAVEEWIYNHASEISGTYAFQTLSMGPAEGWERAVAGGVIPVTPFIGGGLRDLVNRGLAKNIRCNLSQVPRLSRGDAWRADVAFAHCSLPDKKGRVTLGLNAGLDYTPVKEARFRVAVVNENVPHWHIGIYTDAETGKSVEVGCAMHLSEFDLVVQIKEELMAHTMVPKESQRAKATMVAEHILDYLLEETEDQCLPHTLQLGIGTIPNAVAELIASKGLSVSGIWSEMFSDGVLQLYKNNQIKGLDGTYLRNKAVVGFVVGSLELYKTMANNPHFAVVPQEYVNNPAEIARNPYMCSINSTLSISLTGEVAAATIGKKLHSDVGGQFDFAYGASLSEGGVSFIALSSTAQLRNGAVESKIVAHHEAGAHHTIGADLPVVVVTERGCADLRYLDDTDRVRAMIRVADPGFRRHLIKEIQKMPALQGIEVMNPRLVTLRNGTRAILRPATPEDITKVDAYIRCLSTDDIGTRYMMTTTVEALTSAARLKERYGDSLDYIDHAAFILEAKEEILGIAHAFAMRNDQGWSEEKEGWYEVAFSRRSDLEGQGIGSYLMDYLLEWGYKEPEVQHFHATTYRQKNPKMRYRFETSDFVSSVNSEDISEVCYDKDMTNPAPSTNNTDRKVA